MIRIHAVPSWEAIKAGRFTAAWNRRTRQADLSRRAVSRSRFLREAMSSSSDSDAADAWAPPLASPTVVPSSDLSGSGRIDLPALETALKSSRDGRSTSSLVSVAALSAAATAAVIVAISWRTDDEARFGGASLLALVAMTAAFFAGRAILAPNDVRPRRASTPVPTPAPSRADGREHRLDGASAWRRLRSRLAEAIPSLDRGSPKRASGRPDPSRGVGGTGARDTRAVDHDSDRVRRHARIHPQKTAVVVVTEQGTRYDAEILDLSQSGVALEGTMPGVWIGSIVTVGSRRAKAVRMLPHGMALEFSVPIPARMLHVNTVL